jgi:hypothetical protein
MDPRDGRFVMHGHISESGPTVIGALAAQAQAAVAPVADALKAFTGDRFVDGYQGPLTARLDIQPDGTVSDARLMLDRVIHPDRQDTRWPTLVGELLARLGAVRFPVADGPSTLLAPIIFGAPIGQR